jgi:hypothetical protein
MHRLGRLGEGVTCPEVRFGARVVSADVGLNVAPDSSLSGSDLEVGWCLSAEFATATGDARLGLWRYAWML